MRTPTPPRTPRSRTRLRGFTLAELLVVISIIVLITAATLPVVLPALASRKVSEAARTVQAVLAGTRDAAIRAGEPRGIRLIPDPQFPGPNPLAASRMIAIEPAPDYSEGRVILLAGPMGGIPGNPEVIIAAEVRARLVGATLQEIYPPTAWYWNIRQGDRMRFEGSGHEFTVAGPMQTAAANNPDRYVNVDILGGAQYISLPPTATPPSGYVTVNPLTAAPWGLPATWVIPGSAPPTTLVLGELLLLTNGMDDDRDGWIDEGFDGIDNDDDGIIDPGYNGLNDAPPAAIDDPVEFLLNTLASPGGYLGGEYEPERLPTQLSGGLQSPSRYIIRRRPVVAERAQEVVLPGDVVIDLTSWNAGIQRDSAGIPFSPERSRLPVDPITGAVDILISPTGGLVPPSPGQQALLGSDPYSSIPFLHFWLTEREDVVPWAAPIASGVNLILPVPDGTPGYPVGGPTLKRQRRLVTLFARTGQVSSNSIENLRADSNDSTLTPAQNQAINAGRPYLEARSGSRENP